MASKLGVTALYVTPHSGKWGSFDFPDSPGWPPQLNGAYLSCYLSTIESIESVV